MSVNVHVHIHPEQVAKVQRSIKRKPKPQASGLLMKNLAVKMHAARQQQRSYY